MITVSIIIPTFNSQRTIARCIDSILEQEFKDFEICVIDGASSDNTVQIVRDYARRFNNIKLISEKDKCAYDAMNKGIDIARGDWLYFLGADDILVDDKVLENVFIKHKHAVDNSDFIYGNVIWGDTGKVYAGHFGIQKLYRQNICHQAIFVRKGVFDRIGKFMTEYKHLADWHFNILCFVDSEIRKSYIGTVVAKFYLGGISSTQIEIGAKEKRIIESVWLNNVGIKERLILEFRSMKERLYSRMRQFCKWLGIRLWYTIFLPVALFPRNCWRKLLKSLRGIKS